MPPTSSRQSNRTAPCADVLYARLLAEHPEQVPDLHKRASAWFAALGLVADAVRHAVAAEDFERARYLMEEALPELSRTRQDRLLLTWARSTWLIFTQPADA